MRRTVLASVVAVVASLLLSAGPSVAATSPLPASVSADRDSARAASEDPTTPQPVVDPVTPTGEATINLPSTTPVVSPEYVARPSRVRGLRVAGAGNTVTLRWSRAQVADDYLTRCGRRQTVTRGLHVEVRAAATTCRVRARNENGVGRWSRPVSLLRRPSSR